MCSVERWIRQDAAAREELLPNTLDNQYVVASGLPAHESRPHRHTRCDCTWPDIRSGGRLENDRLPLDRRPVWIESADFTTAMGDPLRCTALQRARQSRLLRCCACACAIVLCFLNTARWFDWLLRFITRHVESSDRCFGSDLASAFSRPQEEVYGGSRHREEMVARISFRNERPSPGARRASLSPVLCVCVLRRKSCSGQRRVADNLGIWNIVSFAKRTAPVALFLPTWRPT